MKNKAPRDHKHVAASCNLLADIPMNREQEVVNELLRIPPVRIERIVSRGQSSPPDYWYDQPEDEWVAVLAGEAILHIEGQPHQKLCLGDTLYLPAHTRHRIVWTDPHQATVWLALFWIPSSPEGTAASRRAERSVSES